MRLLVAHPGATHSTADVYTGLSAALEQLGHELVPFPLDLRIDRANDWLRFNWYRARRVNPAIIRPTIADVLHTAGKDLIIQALRLKARGQLDGVLIVSGMYLLPLHLELLRAAGLRTGLVCTESPYDQEREAQWVRLVDVAWTNERTSAAYLRAASGNPNVFYLPHAYDPARHTSHLNATESEEEVPSHDVVFVGSCFWERVEVLSAVDWSGIDLGLYGAWEALPSRHKLRKFLRGRVVDNDTAAALYRRAKIGLNLHRTSKGFGRGAPRILHAESLNPRAYELAACGVFQISDDRAEVQEVFGSSVPTFADASVLSQMLRLYLADDRLRHDAAREARARVQTHVFTARAEQLAVELERAWRINTIGAYSPRPHSQLAPAGQR